jgi:hypothetical protein
MSKLFVVWLVGLVLMAPYPSPLLWLWAAAPFVAAPFVLFHWLTSRR